MKRNFKRLISSLLIAVMVFLTTAFGVVAYAEDLVSINENNFPDMNFRTIVMEVYDTNGDGFLNATERNKRIMTLAAYVEEICGEGKKIESLDGIEFFPNLTKLYCAGIGLTSLDLSSNTSLVSVTAGGNELTEITIGNQPNLTSLDVSVNDITSLNLSTCPNLRELMCYSNQLTTLNVSMLYHLELLYCQQNKLPNLNVQANTELVDLHCSNNNIWELNLTENRSLEGITSADIGNQWVSATAYIQGSEIRANHIFAKPASILSTSIDTVNEVEDGQETTLGFSNGNFIIPDIGYVKDKLVDENRIVYDGIVYTYSVGNENCENMTVNVVLNRNFYEVNYYLDSTKQECLLSRTVLKGASCSAPAVPAAPTCKRFDGWSDVANEVNSDMDIYIIWADNHVIHRNIDKSFNVSIYCENCAEKTISFNFADAYNSERGQSNYIEKADWNNDGHINAKDFALIIHS